MRPTIGIPLCLDDRGRWRPGRRYAYADCAYAAAVNDCGGVAIHLPAHPDPAALLDRIDGLLVPGGDDFLPDAPYPEDVPFDAAPPAQIVFDRSLLEAALARRLPVLGICYGMQLLALARGGTLHHHLPLDVPEADEHRLPEASGRHAIDVFRHSRLEEILGTAPTPVNSLHHQAVADPGADLRVCAHSRDGVIEAIESTPEGPLPSFCIGVQWHPEKLERGDREPLFRAFVEAAEAGPRRHGG